jgi:hypothetical protein
MPRCDTEAMNLHLAEIAAQIAPGHAVLLDQAGSHLSGRLRIPSNITLISNRILKSYDDIVDHCCEAGIFRSAREGQGHAFAAEMHFRDLRKLESLFQRAKAVIRKVGTTGFSRFARQELASAPKKPSQKG